MMNAQIQKREQTGKLLVLSIQGVKHPTVVTESTARLRSFLSFVIGLLCGLLLMAR